MTLYPERAKWEADFPLAVANDLKGNLIDLPNYQEAKAGNVIAALQLVQSVLQEETITKIRQNFKFQKDTLIVPVNALEEAGKNPIPTVFAYELANRLNLEPYLEIVQAIKVARTRKSADYRLVFSPAFSGEVLANRTYLIVDDVLIQGGTVASLRGYINNRGGKVIGVAVLSAKEHSLRLAPSKEILENIRHKFGEELNQFWKEEFNYEISELTHSEATVLSKGDDFISLRNRIAQELLSRGDAGLQTRATQNIPQELHSIIRELKAENSNNVLRLERPSYFCTGRVISHTENFIIQQVAEGSRYYQVHKKADLPSIPAVGEKVHISYSPKEKLAKIRALNKKKHHL